MLLARVSSRRLMASRKFFLTSSACYSSSSSGCGRGTSSALWKGYLLRCQRMLWRWLWVSWRATSAELLSPQFPSWIGLMGLFLTLGFGPKGQMVVAVTLRSPRCGPHSSSAGLRSARAKDWGCRWELVWPRVLDCWEHTSANWNSPCPIWIPSSWQLAAAELEHFEQVEAVAALLPLNSPRCPRPWGWISAVLLSPVSLRSFSISPHPRSCSSPARDP